VADVDENELTQLATHTLPVTAMFERDAVTRNKVHSGFAQAVVSLRYRCPERRNEAPCATS
jgi:hypothetical protein